MKRSRLKRSMKRRKIHRLKSDEAYAFSVKPPKGNDFFNKKEIEVISVGNESVVQDDVIDLYFTSKADALRERKRLFDKGFVVTKIELEGY